MDKKLPNLLILAEILKQFGLVKFLDDHKEELCSRTVNGSIVFTVALKFTDTQIDHCRRQSTTFGQNLEIYKIIKQVQDCLLFLQALESSGNEHIVLFISEKLALEKESDTSLPKPLKILDLSGTCYRILVENFNFVLDQVGDNPFVLLSINGSTRGGKSYILNHFLRYLELQAQGKNPNSDWMTHPLLSDFPSSDGDERVTTGINIWSKPFFVHENGQKIAVLLMDSQGLFDAHTTSQQNAVIFALSNLLSSVMTYNVRFQVDEQILEKFLQFSEYTRAISAHAHDDLAKLMILLRDFEFRTYPLGLQFPAMGEGDQPSYLKKLLNSEPNDENAQVRKKIVQNFKTIDMFLLPHPGKEFVNNPTEILPDQDFCTHSTNFVQFMICNLNSSIKKIGGLPVTGLEFKDYVQVWAKTCENAGTEFPPVSSISEATAELQNERAFNFTIDYFRDEFNSWMTSLTQSVENCRIDQFYATLFENSLQMFAQKRNLGGKELENVFLSKLGEKCQIILANAQKLNLEMQETEKREQEQKLLLIAAQAEAERLRAEQEEQTIQNNLEAERIRLENLRIQEQLAFERLRNSKSSWVRTRDRLLGGKYK